jgi:hypothetical protein
LSRSESTPTAGAARGHTAKRSAGDRDRRTYHVTGKKPKELFGMADVLGLVWDARLHEMVSGEEV